MKRSIWFWVFFVTSIILATYFATRLIMTRMGHTPAAAVHRISVSSDTRTPDMAAVTAAAAIAPGTNTYSVDLDMLNTRVAQTPGVRAAATRRMPNGNISVHTKMHRAVAQWTDGENFFPLSADGTIVRRPSDTRDNASVLFRGPVPGDIESITKTAHNLIGKIDYLEWIENRRWNVITTNGITVMLPEQNPGAAFGTLLVLDKQHNILSRKIRVIDMRDDARILVK
ncbi:hypothetical protein HDR66_01295 [bacterium]|nr:hypothetical protein [bacterium]